MLSIRVTTTPDMAPAASKAVAVIEDLVTGTEGSITDTGDVTTGTAGVITAKGATTTDHTTDRIGAVVIGGITVEVGVPTIARTAGDLTTDPTSLTDTRGSRSFRFRASRST